VQTQRQQQDVGHESVITGRDGFSLRSSIADPQGVAQSPLQSTFIQGIRLNKCHPQLLVMSLFSLIVNNKKITITIDKFLEWRNGVFRGFII